MVLETDNGTNYYSREFKQFSQEWSFTHQTSSPLRPRSNGLAERAVQTAKSLLRKCERGKEDIQMALLNYRNTPREGLGSPVQRLYSRRTRTVLPIKEDLLEPSVLEKTKRERVWTPATVVKQLSPRSYAVRSQDRILRRNQAFLRPFHGEPEAQTSSMDYHKEMENNGPRPLESEHASPPPVPTLLDKTDKGPTHQRSPWSHHRLYRPLTAVKQDGGMARKDFIKQLALQLMRDALNMRNQAKNLSRDLQVLIQKHAGTSSLETVEGCNIADGPPAARSLRSLPDASNSPLIRLCVLLHNHHHDCTITSTTAQSPPRLHNHHHDCTITSTTAQSPPRLHNHHHDCTITSTTAQSLPRQQHITESRHGLPHKPLKDRLNQQKSGLRNYNPLSLLVDHALKNNHTPGFENTAILYQNIKEKHCRLFLESWASAEDKESINRKIDLPDIYTPFRA
ncbi:K02A2.6-like [Cordylochernes scorpioides]|uniref:K02A2.6-like n=1 Tax=Cordylochernes scorpioides TaxID=51811 RepID=A0ABY6L9T3_9ARAC|nr:K02A2.6-like [Cordylochernes scorpioides]